MLVLIGGVWLVPRIVDTLAVYEALLLPITGLPAAIKYLPMLAGVGFLIAAAALNLAITLCAAASRSRG